MVHAGIGSLHCAEKTGTRNVVWPAGQKAMETKSVKVSIIIPVYNVAPYIGDCLQSVMQQSYKGDVECILVDDCGLDESIVIATNEGEPLVGNDSEAGRAYENICKRLLGEEVPFMEFNTEGIFKKIIKIFKRGY